MKTMLEYLKRLSAVMMFALVPFFSDAQTIVGTWQLVKQTSCLEDELESADNADNSLAADMKQMSSPAAEIVKFRDKGVGEESTRILNKKKSANSKNFLYKFNDESLYILDKRSQTISESYFVDKLSQDSLIISNTGRACETKIFVKIKDAR
jgi:hypothetical protein